MNYKFPAASIVAMLCALLLAAGCNTNPHTDTAPATLEPTSAATHTPTTEIILPEISAVELDRAELPRYESLELTLNVDAQYTNPYDARQVRLDGEFLAPDGKEWTVPGFWDGEDAWRVRFTPSQEGKWTYRLVIQDERGPSQPYEGNFQVTPSDLHGWLQVGSWVDPAYSSRYLAHHDGTPFYGTGHCDPLNILADQFTVENGVGLFDHMKNAGENYVVWWPLYSNSPIKTGYDKYSIGDMSVIDLVVRDAQKEGVYLMFTVWDHPELRAEGHAWGDGRWNSNGFHNLGDIASFFTSEEAWTWQENFYRYLIARWGYSPAIGMWVTVSEINGTNAYDQTNPWHEKVNDYFTANDPYRHPTSASMSGDIDWPEGFRAMDAPQVHVYDLEEDAVKSAETLAYWTKLMWEHQEKPNWVGEFGVLGNSYYPEMFHNSIWAALGAGAAMTPAEWNDRGGWGQMTTEMYADIGRLAQFVAGIPLAALNPSQLQIASSDPQVRAWGVAGNEGGLFWVQDFSLQGKTIQEVRASDLLRQGVQVEIQGLDNGNFSITPYDTWQGSYLPPIEVTCIKEKACQVALPDFKSDMAFKVERK